MALPQELQEEPPVNIGLEANQVPPDVSTTSEPPCKSRCLEEVKKIPMARYLCGSIGFLYATVRSSHFLVRWTLGPWEAMAIFIGGVLLSTLRPPLQVADKVVSRLLVRMRRRYPTIDKRPNEFYLEIRVSLAETRNTILSCYLYLMSKMPLFGQLGYVFVKVLCVLADAVDAFFARLENLIVGHLLVDSSDESSQSSSGGSTTTASTTTSSSNSSSRTSESCSTGSEGRSSPNGPTSSGISVSVSSSDSDKHQ